MIRAEWEQIAKALGDLRERIDAEWPPKSGYRTIDPDVHDRRLIRAAKLHVMEEVTYAMCAVLKKRSSRFDGPRFLRMAGLKIKAK
jgi:hypothetical protein